MKSTLIVQHFVFSTYVEVIPVDDAPQDIKAGILHVCGGDPCLLSMIATFRAYSPRMWR